MRTTTLLVAFTALTATTTAFPNPLNLIRHTDSTDWPAPSSKPSEYPPGPNKTEHHHGNHTGGWGGEHHNHTWPTPTGHPKPTGWPKPEEPTPTKSWAWKREE